MQAYLRLLRPPEWIKNTFVFAGLIFGERVGEPEAVGLAVAAFVAFCLASSAGYILNDIVDRHRDRLHPVKKARPIASGRVSVRAGGGLAVGLLVGVGAVSYHLPVLFTATVCGYLVLTLLYSFVLKQRMLLDVITIAVLFVIRALGGAFAVEVEPSPWLLVCTFMFCLFLGFGKRRCEIAMIGNDHAIRGHRPTLVRYTPDLLNHLLSTSAGVAIMTFLLYTLDRDPTNPFQDRKHHLIYTLPIVVYAIYRYAMLIELGKASGPTDLVVKDPPLVASIIVWGLAVLVILYGLPAAV